MTTSRYNARKRRKMREERKAETRRERRIGGDFSALRNRDRRPNEERNNWAESKDRR